MMGNTLNFDHQPEGKPALNDLETVGAIVQKFVVLALGTYHQFGLGNISREAAMASIQDEAAALGRAFMGKDPAYYATDWNSPIRLGAHIRAEGTVKFDSPGQDPGEAFFLWLSTQAVQAANDLQTGTDKNQVGRQIQGVTQSAVKFLLTGAG